MLGEQFKSSLMNEGCAAAFSSISWYLVSEEVSLDEALRRKVRDLAVCNSNLRT